MSAYEKYILIRKTIKAGYKMVQSKPKCSLSECLLYNIIYNSNNLDSAYNMSSNHVVLGAI